MQTLLEKARDSRPSQREITQEHVDLAIAVLKGEITLRQASAAMELKNGSTQTYTTIVRALIKAYQMRVLFVNNDA